jgi:AcrR family transcriptional regulator
VVALTALEVWDQVAAAAAVPVKLPTTDRIVDAALRCIGRSGVAKTTFDDVARMAGCSRATVYRLFPGGKDSLIEAVVQAEVGRLCAGVRGRLEHAASLEDALTAVVSEAGRRIAAHAALQFLLTHEPEGVVSWLAFRKGAKVLGVARALVAPYLAPWLTPEEAGRAAEWAARIVLSYSVCPAGEVDLADEASVRRLVTTFILPGLRRSEPEHDTDLGGEGDGFRLANRR